jgi:magnesium transporter
MIKYYYKNLRSPSVEELQDYRRSAWVYVEAPEEAELSWLSSRFGLEEGHLQDAVDADEMPRLEKEGDKSYIFVRFAYKNAAGEQSTAPLLLIFSETELITISPARLPAMDVFLKDKIAFTTTQRAKLVLQILQQISDQYDALVSGISRQIKNIRARLRNQDKELADQDFINFVMIEDELNEFLSSLLPTNATLRRLLRGRYIPLFEEDQDIVEDLLLDNEQSIEACNSSIKSIVGIRDAHSSISANRLNRTMKILAVATIGIAIPSLFFGMYSMNVAMPLENRPYMFWVVLAFTIAVTSTVFIVGRRKRVF